MLLVWSYTFQGMWTPNWNSSTHNISALNEGPAISGKIPRVLFIFATNSTWAENVSHPARRYPWLVIVISVAYFSERLL